jgi:hypothetical protein
MIDKAKRLWSVRFADRRASMAFAAVAGYVSLLAAPGGARAPGAFRRVRHARIARWRMGSQPTGPAGGCRAGQRQEAGRQGPFRCHSVRPLYFCLPLRRPTPTLATGAVLALPPSALMLRAWPSSSERTAGLEGPAVAQCNELTGFRMTLPMLLQWSRWVSAPQRHTTCASDVCLLTMGPQRTWS